MLLRAGPGGRVTAVQSRLFESLAQRLGAGGALVLGMHGSEHLSIHNITTESLACCDWASVTLCTSRQLQHEAASLGLEAVALPPGVSASPGWTPVGKRLRAAAARSFGVSRRSSGERGTDAIRDHRRSVRTVETDRLSCRASRAQRGRRTRG